MSGMDLTRFEELLDRLGPDFTSWPGTDGEDAARLLTRSPEAREALEAARLLEDVLTEPVPPVREALRRAVLAIPLAEPRAAAGRPVAAGMLERLGGVLGRGWRMATAGAGMALATGFLGFVLGYGQIVSLPGLSETDRTTPERELAMLLDDLDALEELP